MSQNYVTSPFPHFGTDAIHAGQTPDPNSGAVMVPISMASTFAQSSPGVFFPGHFEYSRTGNPTRNAFEANVAGIENGKHGIAFASGMAATTACLHLLKSGDEIVCFEDMYGGTNRYFNRVAVPANNFKFNFIDMQDIANVEKAVTEKTKMVWIESPTNPLLRLVDIKAVVAIAHKVGAIVVVDNTFATPYFQRPLDLGADISLHSVSKYINGHSDVVMGLIVTNSDDLKARLKFLQNGMGGIPSPFDSYLAMRGTKTLHLRMRQHEASAIVLANILEKHPKIKKVVYPGLPSHPQHELAKTQMKGFGGMITLWLNGGIEESRRLLENVKIFTLAESLGGVESLIEHPAIMTHASVPPDQRVKLGIDDAMIRLSVGVEETDDLVKDILDALEKV